MSTKATDFVIPHQKEAVKQYITYDGLNRMEFVYVAIAHAEDGALCLKTQYEYDGTSGRVTKMKESLDNWDSAWDI